MSDKPATIELPGGQRIGEGEPCFVVAEIGQNHQGDVYTAVRLCKAAADAEADAVKFCKRDIASDLTAAAANEPYNGPQSFGTTYYEHRRHLELSPADYEHILGRIGMNDWPQAMFATACDIESVADIETAIAPPLYKIASRDIDNEPLLRCVAKLGKPVVLSSGMGTMQEIGAAIEIVRAYHDRIILLQCRSEYPTADADVGLGRIRRYREFFNVLTGLSDHTPGIVAAQAGATLGAVMVEKHMTLARAMKGTDHACSLEPDGIKRLVRNIRLGEAMAGEPKNNDAPSRLKLGRSLTTTRVIPQGSTVTEDAVCLKSPGTGVRWSERGHVIGHVAKVTLASDVTIMAGDF